MGQEEEIRMIDRFIEDQPLEHLEAVVSAEEIRQMRSDCRQVYIHEDLRRYIVSLVQRTRNGKAPWHCRGSAPEALWRWLALRRDMPF